MEHQAPDDPSQEHITPAVDPEWTQFLKEREAKIARGNTESETKEDGQYTPKEFARLIALSFHFSQGDAQLQGEIFDFLVHYYGDKFSTDLVDAATDEIIYMAYKRASDPSLHLAFRGEGHFKRAKDDNVMPVIMELKDAIEIPIPIEPTRILGKIIDRDHRFICRQSGRDRDHEQKGGPGGMENSQFVQYGATKSPTSSEEYDNFFKTISEPEVLQDYFDTRELNPKVDDPKSPSYGAPLSVMGMPLLEETLFVHFGANPDDLRKIDPEVKQVLLKNISPENAENIGLA